MTISPINFHSSHNKRIKNTAVIIPVIALTASPANSQNILQDRFDEFIQTEFNNADSDKSNYIDENELQTYDSNIKMTDFDTNKDKKLNIYEFKQIITRKTEDITQTNSAPFLPNNNFNQANTFSKPDATKTTTVKKQPVQNKREEAIRVANNLIEGFKAVKKTKPGRLWGTNTYYEPDAKKVDEALNQINSDNVSGVVKQFCYKQKKPECNIYYVLEYLRQNNATDDMLGKATKHCAKVLNEYADKHYLKDNPEVAKRLKYAKDDHWSTYVNGRWTNTYYAYYHMTHQN